MISKRIISAITGLLLCAQTTFVYANPTENYMENTVLSDVTNDYINNNFNIDTTNLNNSISTGAYVVLDALTGEEIIGMNADKVMYPASLTKIMTSLLLIESGKLDDMFTVSKDAAAVGEASMYAQEGEEISGIDLLYAMMLQSANDACYVVAEGISGNVESFYELMTQRAKELGCSNTNFTSANGLHNENHVTSARDLALITKEALKHDEFREVMGAKSYTLTRQVDNVLTTLANKNRMLFDYKPEYNEYVIGGKTAYTTPAGNCLMEIAEKDGTEIIVISLKSSNIYSDTNKIINFVFDNIKSIAISKAGGLTEEYKGKLINLYSKDDVSYITSVDSEITSEDITTELLLNDNLGSEIIQDTVVGKMNVFIDGKKYATVDLYAADNYQFQTGFSLMFIKNLLIFSVTLIIAKIILNVYKMRKAKTKGYLKNSRFY